MDAPEVARLTHVPCLALTLWREARGESYDCREAVAGVVMERARRRGWWGGDITAVCTRPWQFSSLTNPRDVQLVKWPQIIDTIWAECLEIAEAAYSGRLVTPMPGATSYIDVSLVVPPPWATEEAFVGRIGRLKFYAVDDGAAVTLASAHVSNPREA